MQYLRSLRVGFWLFCLALFSQACKSSKTTVSADAFSAFEKRIEARHFFLEAQTANPMVTTAIMAVNNAGMTPTGSSPGRIQLSGGYGIRVENDSISVNLPYYGERQMGGGYDPNDAGIQSKGLVPEMQMQTNNEHQRIEMRFTMEQGSESLRFNVELFPSNRANITVVSSQRNTISYDARIKALEPE